MNIELNAEACLKLVEAMFRHARQEAQRGDAESREWLTSRDARHWAGLCGVDIERIGVEDSAPTVHDAGDRLDLARIPKEGSASSLNYGMPLPA
jgi:hypothetical protein